MASKTIQLICLLISSFALLQMATCSDPDILTDFVVPQGTNSVDGSFFTYSALRAVIGSKPPAAFKLTRVSLVEFPALDGQSVSSAILEYPAGTANPPHTHPRAAELFFVTAGTIQVGFVDTANKLYTQTLQTGDMFVFPKGLVHFQYNCGPDFAAAVSAFGSANPGTVSLPKTLFNTSIDDNVLAVSFKTTVQIIQSLKAGLHG